MMIFQLLSGVLTGLLQADDQFSIPTAASLLQNVSIIISIVVFGSRYGIAAVAVGTLVGAILSTLVKIPGLRLTGFRWTGAFDFTIPALGVSGSSYCLQSLVQAWGAKYLGGPHIGFWIA